MNISGTQNSIFGMNNSRNKVLNNQSGGKLLLVSDLEGCAIKSLAGKAQSRIMCDTKFFDAIQAFLNQNAQNKVAFLGDYFDQGDLVEQTIIEIMKLYKNNEGRVHLILGNRDLNKLRLAEEMKVGGPASVGTGQKWGLWKAFFEGDDIKKANGKTPNVNETTGKVKKTPAIAAKTDLLERLQWIVSKSMGAAFPVNLTNKAVGSDDEKKKETSWLLIKLISDANATDFAEKYGLNNEALSTKYSEFITAARDLFRNGKIVVFDKDFQTLMSHAGGMDTFFFHTPDYYTKITSAIDAADAYYDKMETARQELMKPPTAGEKPTMDENFNLATHLDTYNAPLAKVVNEVLGGQGASADFHLLQALGLKPDNDRHFVSFVQSCDNSSCKGPAAADTKGVYDGYPEFQKTLASVGVKVLASGHAPHCAPVPLIYRRVDYEPTNNAKTPIRSPILFVLNDTSNGYRPADRITGLETYPLAYVTKGGNKAGVGMFQERGFTPASGMEADEFGPMFGEWSLESAPIFDAAEGKRSVQYTNGQLTFPGRYASGFDIYKAAAFVKSQGGGRRRKQKTRKSKKASRKGRKTRKY